MPFKLVSSQIFCKNYCRKTIEAAIMKKKLNVSKLFYAINIFIVDSWCLLFWHGSHLNTKTNYNFIFSVMLTAASMEIVIFENLLPLSTSRSP